MSKFSKDQIAEAFEYLDDLRAGGATNMWGASPFIERDMNHSQEDASELLGLWMDSFDPDKPSEIRASEVAQKLTA